MTMPRLHLMFVVILALVPRGMRALPSELRLMRRASQVQEEPVDLGDGSGVEAEDEGEEDAFQTVRTAALELQQVNDFVVLMLLNADYLRLARNWVCRVRGLDGNVLDKTIFVATEVGARDSLLAFDRGLRVVLTEEGEVQRGMHAGQRAYSEYMLFRTRLQRDLLTRGVTILNVEADSTWFQNPLAAVLAQPGDIVAYSDAPPPAKLPSFGFMLLRATPGTVALWTDLEARCERLLNRWPEKYDGEVDDPGVDRHPLLLQALLKRHADVQVGWLSREVIVPGLWYTDRNLRSSGTSVVHNNYVVGSAAKERRAAELGHWFLDIAGVHCVARDQS